MNVIRNFFKSFSDESRRRRAEIFRNSFKIGPDTKILDLGSEDGSAIASLLDTTSVRSENVWIADIDQNAVRTGAARYGFNPVVLQEFEALPFENNFFDVVYCSSVIEHVTVPKSEVWRIRKTSEFRSRSLRSQTFFANEIIRVGKSYFVQSPNRFFPIESHTWLPFLGYFPRPFLIAAMRLANIVWVKKSIPDFNLLNSAEMQKLFPDARIEIERRFGIAKSLMAIKIN